MAILDLIIIAVTSLVIFYSGGWFASASSSIGNYFNLPKSIKGATLDAISSSAPELLIAVFSVIAFGQFDLGIGTIVGSALFNLLFIPAICLIISKKNVELAKDVVYRDGSFYALSVLLLLLALIYSSTWGLAVPLVLLGVYGVYIYSMFKTTEKYWNSHKQKNHSNITLPRQLSIALASLIAIGIATYFLTGHSISFAKEVNVPPVLIGFTIVAIATSLPDGVISVTNSRKGNMDDAISNMLGSNIFNILLGLSIPLLLTVIIKGPVEILFAHPEVVVGLLVVAVGLLALMLKNRILTPARAIVLLLIFFSFQSYFVYLAFS